MGLIKAISGAVGGTLADQWKEFFYCDSLDKEVLVAKGVNKISKRSSNTKGNDNIISNMSGIAVADGQCMIIVEQGKVVELCAEPGEYTYDKSSEPSIFAGQLGGMIKTMFKRISYGGDTGKDQRIYYFNLKEIMDNKFGTPTPIPFKIVDKNIGLDLDSSVRCHGIYSYKISNPLLFYQNVCGNVESNFTRSQIDTQLKAEFMSALQPSFGKLSRLEMRPSDIPFHTAELEEAMNDTLSPKWKENRGIEIATIAINSVSISDEDQALIKDLQRKAVYRNAGMAGANLADAQAEALKNAASNSNGVMAGFMGMNMAQNAANAMNIQGYYQMEEKNKKEEEAKKPQTTGAWTCPTCHIEVSGNFCPECGSKKPADGWTCPECGNVNKGKFCSNCGTKKPLGSLLYKCDKCGWEPADPTKPPRFCPECGDPFDEKDIK